MFSNDDFARIIKYHFEEEINMEGSEVDTQGKQDDRRQSFVEGRETWICALRSKIEIKSIDRMRYVGEIAT